VRVGTTNSPKLEAVRAALEPYLPEVEVAGHAVESGVSDQPVGFAEIVTGARNRARAAFEGGDCELAVGIEDGLALLPGVDEPALNIGAAVLTDGRRDSLGLSSGFGYPPECLEPALAGREPIGDLFDALWRSRRADRAGEPSGLSVGNIGKLSLGVLPRSEYGRHAVLCALIRFMHPDLYFGPPPGERDG
jgi:inosine/xanthosine triphosphatase